MDLFPVLLLVTCVSSVLIVTVPNVLMCHAATVVCTAFHCSLTALGAVVLGTYAYLWAAHRRLTRQQLPSCCCRCDDGRPAAATPPPAGARDAGWTAEVGLALRSSQEALQHVFGDLLVARRHARGPAIVRRVLTLFQLAVRLAVEERRRRRVRAVRAPQGLRLRRPLAARHPGCKRAAAPAAGVVVVRAGGGRLAPLGQALLGHERLEPRGSGGAAGAVRLLVVDQDRRSVEPRRKRGVLAEDRRVLYANLHARQVTHAREAEHRAHAVVLRDVVVVSYVQNAHFSRRFLRLYGRATFFWTSYMRAIEHNAPVTSSRGPSCPRLCRS